MPTFMLVSLILCLAGVPVFADSRIPDDAPSRGSPDGRVGLALPGRGVLVAAWRLAVSRTVPRVGAAAFGYVLSLPLYFAGLWVSYAAIGYHFAPQRCDVDDLPVGLAVVLPVRRQLWSLVRRPRFALVIRRLAVAVAVAGVAAPFVAFAATDRVTPARRRR
jgi:hypothetical protein